MVSGHTLSPEDPLRRIFFIVLVSLALYFLASYGVVGALRLTSPLELEWMEGGAVLHVHQLLQGRALYPPPSIEFTPFTYPPLYFWLSAALVPILGDGFLPLRAVSFISSWIVIVLLYLLTVHETGMRRAGLLTAGFFASTYSLSGYWFDIARIDSLFLAFFLGAVFLHRCSTSRVGLVSAALLYLFAALTKQVAVIMALPLIIGEILYGDRRRGLILLALVSIGGALLAITLWISTDGWASFYLFQSPRLRWRQFVSLQSFLSFLLVDIGITFIPLLLAVVLAQWQRRHGSSPRTASTWFIPALFFGLVGGACMGRIERINYLNTLMPLHVAAAIISGLIISQLSNVRSRAFAYGSFLLGLQFLVGAYNPFMAVPEEWREEESKLFREELGALQGPILWTDHPLLLEESGIQASAHTIGISDALLGDKGEIASALRTAIEEAIRSHHYSHIILDSGLFETHFGDVLMQHYRPLPADSSPLKRCVPVHRFCALPKLWIPR